MSAARKPWLDWQRGLAVLFMIEVHLLDAWLVPEARGAGVDVMRFIGGLAAPGFLYMAGVGWGLREGSQDEVGVPAAARRREGVRRGLYVLGMAYVFRVVEYVLGGAFLVDGGWRGIFKVDILNVIGASLLVLALGAGGRGARWRVGFAAFAAAALVVATPLLAQSGASIAAGYVYTPRGFTMANWAGYALAGAALVSLGRPLTARFLAGVGLGLVAVGVAAHLAPPLFAVQDFWGSSPAFWLIRLGCTVVISGGLAALPQARPLAPLTLMGRHSLVLYMASVELTYGLLLGGLKKSLGLPVLVVAIVVMSAAMLGLAGMLERRRRLRLS